MLASTVCIPHAANVPGQSGPPDWLGTGPNSSTKLDDPHWFRALSFSHGGGVREHATFRAVYDTDTSQNPPVESLYLSWLVRVDEDDLTVDLGKDALHVGFVVGQQAVLIRIKISQAQTAATGVSNDKVTQMSVYLWKNNKWTLTTQTLDDVPWLRDTARAWTRQPFDNSPNLPPDPMNKVPWAIQMKVPHGEIISANVTGTTPIVLGSQFQMWYALVVTSPSSTPSLKEYTWPESNNLDYHVQLDANGNENVFPDPFNGATWGTVKVGGMCNEGVTIELGPNFDNIGTDNSPSSRIDPSGVNNVLYAEPLNRTGSPLAASNITARFRLANWGSSYTWSDIRGGNAVAGDASVPDIPDGNTGGPGGGKHYIHFTWALNAALGDDVANYQANKHQCMLVELSSPIQDLTFINNSVFRNMDFSPPLTRKAQINIRGLEPIAIGGREVFLHLEVARLPFLIGAGRPEIGILEGRDAPIDIVEAHRNNPHLVEGASMLAFRRQSRPMYVVHVYHDTGKKMLIDKVPYAILRAQPSFGYVILDNDEMPTYGWNYRLEGAKVIGNNYYTVTVPNNGAVPIVTTVEPLKQPRGARDSGFMVQSNIGDKGDFEVVVPHERAGLVYCSRNNDTKGFPWGNSAVFAQELGYVDAVSLIQSNFGNPGNLEVVARVKDRLFYLSGSGFDRTWSKPVTIAEGVSGNPALIQGRYGIHGNFELVVPFAGGGIIHYWRNNDDPKLPWLRGDIFAQNLGNVDAVALIQSNIQDKAGEPQPGHLEVIARVGNDLIHLWRNDGPAFKWSDSDPVKFYEAATGIPGFIQGNYGGVGHFEVVTPSKKGGMAHLRRNNDDPRNFPWKVATMFGGGNVTAVSLLQSNFTTSTNPNISGPGNFEVAARIEGRTALYWRHDLPPFTWEDAKTFACS